VGQPDLVTGANFRCNAGKFHWQFLDQRLAEGSLELRGKLVAADQAWAVEADIEVAEDISRLQAARPCFQGIELARRIGAADDRADRRADHDIGDDAMLNQCPDNADMGKSARGAAAQRQPDHRPPGAAKSLSTAAICAVLAAPD
jgi:hypothetical protein